MNTMVWLQCEIKSELNSEEMTISVVLQDGVSTDLIVDSNTLMEKDEKYFVRVESMGTKNKLAYVKLPSPTLLYGHLITVNNEMIKSYIAEGKSISEVLLRGKKKKNDKKS